MLLVSELHVYPIKSLGGISVDTATVTATGLQYDRRWMLVDSNHRFLTQREFPEMALLQVSLENNGLLVHHKKNKGANLFIPFQSSNNERVRVEVWDDTCEAELADTSISEWFSDMLSMSCRLVYMPDTTRRIVDERYATDKEITSFSDGYPILIIGQSSLDDLNSRMEQPLPMNRFRPNIVFTGATPFEEDTMECFSIHGIDFFAVKPCARCVMTTINQDEAVKAKEPLKTLATYRMKDNKIFFGQNLLYNANGIIRVGDAIEVKRRKIGLFAGNHV